MNASPRRAFLPRSFVALLAVTAAVGLVACAGDDGAVDDAPTSPVDADASSTASLAERFDPVRVEVTDADGVSCGLCMWLADNENLRRQGLMGVLDLEGADGMVFAFDPPTSGGFWMKDTLIPLDVAFFDDDGAFMAADSMEPCPAGTANCPIYDGPPEYSWAIEVPAGRATVYGMEPGGRIAVTGPCDPAATSAATS